MEKTSSIRLGWWYWALWISAVFFALFGVFVVGGAVMEQLQRLTIVPAGSIDPFCRFFNESCTKTLGELGEGFFTELLVALALSGLSLLGLARYRDRRRKSFGQILLKNHYRLIAWNYAIIVHVYGDEAIEDIQGVRRLVKSPNLIRPIRNESVEKDEYRTNIHSLIAANESAKRAVEINNTILSDAFLRLETPQVDLIAKNTHYAYEITTIFDYILERLSHFELHRHGYHDSFDPTAAADVVNTLWEDLHDADFLEDARKFRIVTEDVLIMFGASRKDIDEIMSLEKRESCVRHNHESRKFDVYVDKDIALKF